MTDLRCSCVKNGIIRHDKIAEYSDDTVNIKCPHGSIVTLKVIDNKLTIGDSK